MAELKTKETDASVDQFLDAIADDERRADCIAIAKLMKKITRCEPRMWGKSMVGFGRYHYKYASGREGEWFLTGFAPRKNDLTLYIMAGFAGSSALMKRLGKHKTGKSCLYIKRRADIDSKVLEQLIEDSVATLKKTYG